MPPKFSYASALSQPKPAPPPLLCTQPPNTPSTHVPSSSSPARADRDTSRSDLSRGSLKRVQPKPPAKSSPKPPPKMSVANVEPSPKPERPSAGGQGEGPKTPAPQPPSPKAPAASDTAGGEGEPKPKKKKKKAVQLPPAPPPVFVEDDFPSLSRGTPSDLPSACRHQLLILQAQRMPLCIRSASIALLQHRGVRATATGLGWKPPPSMTVAHHQCTRCGFRRMICCRAFPGLCLCTAGRRDQSRLSGRRAPPIAKCRFSDLALE